MRDTGASVVSTVPEGTTSGTDLGDKSKADSKLGTRPSSPERPVPLYDKDLIRMLAEVQFIQGEVILVFECQNISSISLLTWNAKNFIILS